MKLFINNLRLVVEVVATVGWVFSHSFNVICEEIPPLNSDATDRLPQTVDGRFLVPDIGCFWSFSADGDEYKKLIDAVAPTGAFDVLTITLRSNNSIVGNSQALQTTKKAVEYARDKYGIRTLLDIDLRIARYDFEKRYPDLLQERLLFKEQPYTERERRASFHFEAPNLTDHYTGNLPYYSRGGRVVKAWAYNKTDEGAIDPKTIVDVSKNARCEEPRSSGNNNNGVDVDPTSTNEFNVEFLDAAQGRAFITCAVAFKYSYPDVFADETMDLEREIYEYYRDAPAYGVAKDEWGFPPYFNRDNKLDDFWYSERARLAYADAYEGRDLVDDLFLLFLPRLDADEERVSSFDRYQRLCSERVVSYEYQNYDETKKIWGDDSFVGVHCTWYPWPNVLEMRKNGIMWWKAKRDVAQTDEYTPFCVRNSLAKKTGSLWINMFYAQTPVKYIWEHWTAVASGGRVHLHSLYPRGEDTPTNPLDSRLLPIVGDARVAEIRQKIRILNFISNSQIDSPVAVIFGRFAAANPLSPNYKVIGWDLCDRFSTQGYPADLIPIDEINAQDRKGEAIWKVSDGYLQYGSQKYSVIILNGGGECEREDYEQLRQLATSTKDCKTEIISLPPNASSDEKDALVSKIVARFEKENMIAQTPWVCDNYNFGVESEVSSRPPRKCVSRFLDGTILWIAAEENDFGDPITLNDERLRLRSGDDSPSISVEANGVFAVRFDEQGELIALAASELKSFRIGEFGVKLSEEEIGNDPVDVAIWRDESGEWRGVLQREKNDLPHSLKGIVKDWRYLRRR